MTGSFDSYHQSIEDSAFYNVSLNMVPIWQDRNDAYWLYVEQAMSAALDKPYRQRVYKVTKGNDNNFISAVYKLNNEKDFANAYDEPERFKAIGPKDLTEREGCEIVMTREGDKFVGSTGGNKCASSLRGATYATSKVLIDCNGISSWDQGWNDQEEQVWGAEVGPYYFDRKFEMAYPESKIVDTIDTYFGVEVADPYRWLEDENSGDTKEWVAQQNLVTESYLSNIPYREKINQRLTELYNYERQGLPKKEGEHYYFTANDGLQNQSPIFRTKKLGGESELFLDPNTFSDDGTISIAGRSFSKDGKYFAYLTSEGGSDWREIFVMNTETGKPLKDHLIDIKFSGISWYGDGFFYSRYDNVNREKELSDKNTSRKVYYHKLGDEQSEDELVYWNEENPLRGAGASVSKDEQFIYIYESQGTHNNKYFFARSKDFKRKGFNAVVDDFDSNFWAIGNEGETIFAITDRNAPNYRLVKFQADKWQEEYWEDVIPESENLLDGVNMAGDKFVVQYFENVADKLYVYSLDGEKLNEIELPTFGTVNGLSTQQGSDEVFYSFNAATYPSTNYQYDLKTGKQSVLFKPTVDFEPEDFVTTRVDYPSKDGTMIPMYITHKKDVELDGNNPTLLYGYGGFNISIKQGYSSRYLPFLENGGVFATATLRGGGEFGEEWHKAGMQLNKQNVFDDFIAAAEYLVAENYTNADKLCIYGRSNGGLLVGAVMTQRPELFKATLPTVGVMDMLRYHKFTIGWAWADDYGSSDDEEHFKNLLGYSPLHNIDMGTRFPATLVTTADRDDRVVPAHSYKFAAAMQAAQRGDNPILIRIDTKAGHGSGKSISQYIEENTDIWSFVFDQLGMSIE